MNISIDKTTLLTNIEEEISRVASRAYAEDGSSLYDAIVKKSRDGSFIDREVSKATAVVQSACGKYLDMSSAQVEQLISFGLTLTERKKPITYYESLLNDILRDLVVARYLDMVQQVEQAKRYDESAASSLTLFVKELYSKTPPIR